jgi:hypothetical protein
VAAGHRSPMNASTPAVLSIIGVELLFVSGWLGRCRSLAGASEDVNNGVLQRPSYITLPHAITIGEVGWPNAANTRAKGHP